MDDLLRTLLGEAERVKGHDGSVDPGLLSAHFRAARLRADPRDRDTYRRYMEALQRARVQGLISETRDGRYRLGGRLEGE